MVKTVYLYVGNQRVADVVEYALERNMMLNDAKKELANCCTAKQMPYEFKVEPKKPC